MGRATWLPAVLEAAGLNVIRTPGADTRGSSAFDPHWQVFHHTASPAGSDHPALGICTNGRSDLPGPLCNILVARNGDCYYVASGRANHAGAGRYPDGSTGNSRSIGWECENNGIGEGWPAHQLDVIARGQAAVCRHLGGGADRVIYHREYTSRKIDPAGPGIPQNGNDWRAAVAATLNGTGGFGTMTDKEINQLFIDAAEQSKAREAEMLVTIVDYIDGVAVAQGVDPKEVRNHLGPKTKKVLTAAQKLRP